MVTVVYISQGGTSKRYAEWLAKGIGSECIEFNAAMKDLPPKSDVIFVGWRAGPMVVAYPPISEKFNVIAVVIVALEQRTEKDIELIKKKNSIENLFYVRGGMDRSKLLGKQKFILGLVSIKMLLFNHSEEDKHVRDVMDHGGDMSSEDQIQPAIDWYNSLGSSTNRVGTPNCPIARSSHEE